MNTLLKFMTLGLFATLLLEARTGLSEEHHTHDHSEHENEGLVLSPQELTRRGIFLETAGEATLSNVLTVNAKISANSDTLAHLHPRFPGIIKEVRKQVGEHVSKGEVLALIESNQSLQRYEVTSLTDGTVLYRHATLGEFVEESQPMFVVADLSSVWADLHIFPRDFSAIAVGQRVTIRAPYRDDSSYPSQISFTSAVVDEESQARIARAVISNPRGELLPDQYVSADIVLDTFRVGVAVKTSALQRVGDRTIIFILENEALLPREVVTGRADRDYCEIISDLESGARYAAGETFLLKAELGKGSAEHEH